MSYTAYTTSEITGFKVYAKTSNTEIGEKQSSLTGIFIKGSELLQ